LQTQKTLVKVENESLTTVKYVENIEPSRVNFTRVKSNNTKDNANLKDGNGE
jgi:hypothetical protein